MQKKNLFKNKRIMWPNSNGTHWPGLYIVPLCGDCYLPCETRKLFSHWVTVRVCVCERERERETQSAFPLNEISWLRLIPSGYATCSELNYVVPGDVTLETTPIPGTCCTYWLIRGAYDFKLLERRDKGVFSSLFILYFSSFSRYSFFLFYLKANNVHKSFFENISRNRANAQLTRHLQITSWSKIQDTFAYWELNYITMMKEWLDIYWLDSF
jgi:hypothetical protein